ncbi:uncharacterized protein LOC132631092 [Lycium barbarum]|uniref:uncharacterized protein LOC132631092 n=1 Tax=Lycium barbarum TaxID=112863 RepID=UPI00293E641E|nr:uncharacterized protein LOC132631092 [Lycium barbarum]
MGPADTIQNKNQATNQDRAKAMIFLRRHLDEDLKLEYLTIKDPFMLLNNLKDRHDHLKMLKLCGANITDNDLLEKTFTTFYASNVLLQQQYREMGLKRYSELISHHLVAEQNNGLLMKNHESRPTGSNPFPEVNETHFHQDKRGKGRGPNPRRGPSNGHDRGRGKSYNHDDRLAPNKSLQKKDEKHEAMQRRNPEDKCHRYGGKGHLVCVCRTPRHLVELYQASLKRAEKNAKANFISEDNDDFMHLDVADYFALPQIDPVIRDESIET